MNDSGTTASDTTSNSPVKLSPLLAAASCSLLLVACGDDEQDSTGSPTTVTEPTPVTDPAPTTPTVAPTTTGEPAGPHDLPTRPMEVDDGGFTTLEELAAVGELVVVGTVTDEVSLGRPDAAEDPHADEFLGLTLRVDSTLKGSATTEIRLAWDAYLTDETGERVAEIVMNGIPVPHVGDQLVLFLRPADAQFAAHLDGFPTHAPVALDGIGFVVDSVVTITDTSSPATQALMGQSIEQITASM